MALWHTDIKFPEWFVAPTGRVNLDWTRHADKARTDDRYGEIPKFDSIPLCPFDVIEIETCEDYVTKYVIRGHYTEDIDVIFVLIPNGRRPWTVKTVWQNLRTDKHRTLDRRRYVC